MTLGDVVPAIQQGAIDGAVGGIVVWTPMHFQDAAKYVTETGQPAVYAVAEVSKKWYDSLPADLQKIVDSDAATQQTAIYPVAIDIVNKARKGWTDSGGELDQPAVRRAGVNDEDLFERRRRRVEDKAFAQRCLQDRDRSGTANAIAIRFTRPAPTLLIAAVLIAAVLIAAMLIAAMLIAAMLIAAMLIAAMLIAAMARP